MLLSPVRHILNAAPALSSGRLILKDYITLECLLSGSPMRCHWDTSCWEEERIQNFPHHQRSGTAALLSGSLLRAPAEYHSCVSWVKNAHHGAHLEVRGQLSAIGFHSIVGSENWPQDIRLARDLGWLQLSTWHSLKLSEWVSTEGGLLGSGWPMTMYVRDCLDGWCVMVHPILGGTMLGQLVPSCIRTLAKWAREQVSKQCSSVGSDLSSCPEFLQ